MPGGFVCSGSLKASADVGARQAPWAPASEPSRKLFSKEQRAFFAAHAPEGVELDGLRSSGRSSC